METNDTTVRILIEIRDEIRSTNHRLDHTNDRLDQTVDRLDQTVGRLDQTVDRLDRLEHRVVESELRLGTAVTAMAGTLHDVHALLSDRLDLRARVEVCEREIDELKRRVH